MDYLTIANVSSDIRSVKKLMPKYEKSILKTVIELSQNGKTLDNDVFIKAVSPRAVELEIKPEDAKKPIIKRILDPRYIYAQNKKTMAEDVFYKTEGKISQQQQAEIDKQFQIDLEEIEKNPFDFRGEIIKTFNETVKAGQ